MNLQDLIDQTIAVIRGGMLDKPSVYPPMYHTAAVDALSKREISITDMFDIFPEMIVYQNIHGVLDDPQKLLTTSLSDFLGLAAKKKMDEDPEHPGEYQRLWNERMHYISPFANAE